MPLIGALAAGNCAVLKPSAYAPACSRALAELVAQSLPPELAAVVEGGRAENQAPAGPALRLYLFHRKSLCGPRRHGAGRRPSHPGDPGAWRQEPGDRGR